MNEKMKGLLLQEEELQFNRFNADVAWQLGCDFAARAKTDNLSITVDITHGDHQLFHLVLLSQNYSLDGIDLIAEDRLRRRVRRGFASSLIPASVLSCRVLRQGKVQNLIGDNRSVKLEAHSHLRPHPV